MAVESTRDDIGLVLPRDRDGKRSSIALGRAVFADALRAVDAEGAAAIDGERAWHQRYPLHVVRLVEAGARSPDAALAVARAGLGSLHARLRFADAAGERALPEALAGANHDWRVARLSGQGPGAPAPLAVPFGEAMLSGDALRRRLDAWLDAGRIEPSHAAMLHWVMDHPEALDLSDQRIVLLGACAEMGPLAWLSRWRAQLVAVDLPRPAIWRRIVDTVRTGNGTLHAPVRGGGGDDAEAVVAHGGADLLTDLPGLVAWLCDSDRPLTLGAYAYLDGALHVRVSAAMDTIQAAVLARRPDSTLAMLATPTDAYAVPAEVREAAHARYARRGYPAMLAAGLSDGRLMKRNLDREVIGSDGRRWGVADSMVVQQGPNYALAKRVQQWRALAARADGAHVSIHVAPPATTLSVVKSKVLANAYRGAIRFGVEAFHPRTASALMAACLVHDLRNPAALAHPQVPLAHPLDLLVHGAAHGGLWRIAYQPRTVLPLAAVMGSMGLA
jgi:hypothetical protein